MESHRGVEVAFVEEAACSGRGLRAWMAWNSQVLGANDQCDSITRGVQHAGDDAVTFSRAGNVLRCAIDLPLAARALDALGEDARLAISVRERPVGDAQETDR